MIDKERTVSTITANNFITQAHKYSKGKVCSTCNIWKLLSEFGKASKHKDGLMYECKSCKMERRYNMCPFKKWFIGKKSNAKRRDIEFTIEPTDIPGVKIREIKTYFKTVPSWEATEYPKVCPVLGMKLDWSMNGKQGTPASNSPSLDRDPKFGYIPGKVMMMSQLANMMKSNATSEQLKQFSRYFLFENNK